MSSVNINHFTISSKDNYISPLPAKIVRFGLSYTLLLHEEHSICWYSFSEFTSFCSNFYQSMHIRLLIYLTYCNMLSFFVYWLQNDLFTHINLWYCFLFWRCITSSYPLSGNYSDCRDIHFLSFMTKHCFIQYMVPCFSRWDN